jgi:hypothetical protein
MLLARVLVFSLMVVAGIGGLYPLMWFCCVLGIVLGLVADRDRRVAARRELRAADDMMRRQAAYTADAIADRALHRRTDLVP